MDGLEKFVKVASNQTKLKEITKGNATKVAEIQKMGDVAQMKLSAMQGNATFVAACAALNGTDKGALSESATNGTGSKKSGAVVLDGGAWGAGVWVPVAVVALGMWVL